MSMHLRFFKKFKLRSNVVVEELVMIKAALLSVIIPVYNVEPYLEQCLDSVVNQTYKNLEIICINDGSTDNSLKILEKFRAKDERIKLIDQKNGGASIARNVGLDLATGEYIAFVDSDDYLELNAYEEAMKVMLKNRSVDLVEFNVKIFSGNNDQVSAHRVQGLTKYYETVFNSKKHSDVIWNKIFKSDIIKKMNIRFISGLIHDDIFFSHAFTMCSKCSEFLNLSLYNYRVWNNSITGKLINSNVKFITHIYYNYDALVDFAKLHNLFDCNKRIIYRNYIDNIFLFCNDTSKLSEAVRHWDEKILDSECPDDLKTDYEKKVSTMRNMLRGKK